MAPLVRPSALAAAALAFGVGSAVPRAPTIRLRNGVEMPFLALGTGGFNNSEAETAILAAFQVGFNHVDTAFDYGNQVGVGRAVNKSGLPRESLFIETKVPGCGASLYISVFNCYEDTKKVLEMDLQQLGQQYVDLVLIHFPPIGSFFARACSTVCKEVQDQWRALEEFYAAGKAKAIGVSNYCPSCFECLDKTAKVYPMINQAQMHLGMGSDPGGFRSYAEQRGIVLQAYSPLGDNFLKPGANPEILNGPVTTAIAKAHGVSTIQVALKWLVQRGVPTATKSGNPAHLAEDLDLWSWNMTDAELQQGDQLHIPGIPSFMCNKANEEAEVQV